LQDAGIRETILKERVRASKMFRSLRRQRHRLCFFSVTGCDDFLVCVNSFRNLFGLYVREWETLLRECRSDYLCGPIVHGNKGNKSRHDASLTCLLEADVVQFLQALQDEKGTVDCCVLFAVRLFSPCLSLFLLFFLLGEDYATRFVREATGVGLRKEEEGLVELPSCTSKRQEYCRFCYDRGWKCKASAKGSFGPVSEYQRRTDEEWNDREPEPVCSWSAFHKIWKEKFPKMKIRNPCEDTCGECMKLRNRIHVLDRLNAFRHRQQYRQEHQDPTDDEDGSDSSNDYVYPVDRELFQEFSNVEYPDEVVILECNAHVVHAQAQRALARDRIEAAKSSRDLDHEHRR
jgi:hypothetical protein